MAPEMPLWLLVYFTAIGLVVGSFLNVVIYRLPAGLSVVRPRSRCSTCGETVRWYDNVPILSYLWLRGRCRSCGQSFSPRYPLIELLTASLIFALCLRFGLSWQLLLWGPLVAALVAITFLDIDHWWVPDVITFPAMVWAFLGSFLPGGLGPLGSLLGLLPALMLWGVAWIFEKLTKREGLGLGDVKLLMVLGLALGLADCLTALFLAAMQGAVVGAMVILAGGHKGVETQADPEPVAAGGASHDEDDWVPHPRAIPFGPFLALGAFEVLFLPSIFGDLPTWLARTIAGLVA